MSRGLLGRFREVLIKHEALRNHVYKDSAGVSTIGVGRNLEDVGISTEEALLLLQNDMVRTYNACIREFSWFLSLTQDRKIVVMSMVFNMGLAGFKTFERTIAAISNEDWDLASAEMLDSEWRSQVGQRAIDLSEMMRQN